MSTLRWIMFGVLSVGIPMAAAYDPSSLWPSLTVGTAAGCLFLAGLILVHWRKIPSRPERTVVATVAALLIAGSLLQLHKQWQISSFQSDRLRSVRTSIGAGTIVADKIQSTMLPVLSAYHRQSGAARLPMAPFFRQRVGAALESGLFNRQLESESDAVTMVSYSGDTVVIFHCTDTIARGTVDGFVNRTGHRGRLEFRAELDAKGIRYERLN